MNIAVLENGNLRITAGAPFRARLTKLAKLYPLGAYPAEAAALADELRCRQRFANFQQTAPCSVGALTDAPLITDGIAVWGFMDYQVASFLELLRDGKETIWIKG